ncbi:hypothetical protein B9Z19DRAFT_1122575 [Tuber borchii]|uniref:Uncharacterized protein n=1 Tax=Tuber borchii TaxID=42251 RepID=A0A2T7A035_TUBBO|nr:hypothetical protein B9Z19DRAFT_1122575 [Tuber borchii]
MLSARPNYHHSPGSAPSKKSQQQIARIMFEKNFISASTGSLADIGLNFFSARRVMKYILRPLKLLSKTAIELNEISSISTHRATDIDEISTGTSNSDIGDISATMKMISMTTRWRLMEEMEDEGHSDISDEEHEEGEGMAVEIVVEAERGSEDDDGDDDDEGSDDMDDEVEISAEMSQDQVHYGSGHEEDMQSGGSEGEEDQRGEKVPDNDIEAIVDPPGGSPEAPESGYEDRNDGFIHDDSEEDDEDDDDDIDEEEAIIQEDYEDDENAFSAVPWGWADETGEAPMMARAHPSGHGGWYPLGPLSNAAPPHHYMGGTAPRIPENATARPTHNHSQEFITDWVQAIDGMHATDGLSLINTLLSLMTRPGQHFTVLANGASIHFQAALPHLVTITTITAPHSRLESYVLCSRQLDPQINWAMIRREYLRILNHVQRHHREDLRTAANNSVPTLNTGRWTEESRLLFDSSATDRTQRLANAILVLLVPPAIEGERITKRSKKRGGKRLKNELAAETAELAAAAPRESDAPDGENSPKGEPMEGIKATQGEAPRVEAGPSHPPAPRATLMICGCEMDITGMDSNPGLLEVLHEELREEVLTQHIWQRREESAI